MSEYILELKDVVKRFGGVTALNQVCFQLRPGEVHALMGENGAGKSTLIKTMTGVYVPDAGEILFNGEKAEFHSAKDSAVLGIAAVYQHATAFPDLTVTENIFMGQELRTKLGLYDWKSMRRRAKELLAPLSPSLDVKRQMSSLSVAEQQLVEIAKATSRELRVLILDEPTACLTTHECEELYGIVEKLKAKGVAIVFISHRMEDMYRLADRVTVFRDAHYIGTWEINAITEKALIGHMVGRELDQMYPARQAEIGEDVLEVKHLSRLGKFKDVSFHVRKGEVVALTGLVGAGRTEVCESLFGIVPANQGEIFMEGKAIQICSTRDAFACGIGLLPEDRQRQGLFEDHPIYQNISAANLNRCLHGTVLDVKAEKERASELCGSIQLKASSISAPPSSLSGGNQQKVVFAKLLNCDLKVLLLDEPTKGVDVGAKFSIYSIINDLAAKGCAVLLVSSEMPEVIGMADRVYVMSSGRITAEYRKDEVTQEKLLQAALMKKGGVEA